MKLDKLATLCRHHVQAIIAKPIANGGIFDERIMSGLQWLVDAIGSDLSSLHLRREREMKIAATAEAERKAKARADYEARKAAREAAAAAAAATVGPVAGAQSSSTGGGTGATPPAAVPAAVAEQPKKPAPVIVCTSCKVNPAAKRCAASGWQAVCMPCADRLEGKVSGADAAVNPSSEGTAADAVASATASATASAAPLVPVHRTEGHSSPDGNHAELVVSNAAGEATSTTTNEPAADHPKTQEHALTDAIPLPALTASRGPVCAECKEAEATRKATKVPGEWVPVCAACGARFDTIRMAQAASAIEAATAAPLADARQEDGGTGENKALGPTLAA